MRSIPILRIGSFFLALALGCGLAACRSQAPSENSAATGQTAAQYVAQAEKLYAQRDDLNAVRKGIILLRQAHSVEPGNYEAAWKLSKFDYYLTTHSEIGDERNQAVREGIEAGKAAVSLQKDKADGHFWLGANYGAAAESSSLFGLATIGDIRAEMETVL